MSDVFRINQAFTSPKSYIVVQSPVLVTEKHEIEQDAKIEGDRKVTVGAQVAARRAAPSSTQLRASNGVLILLFWRADRGDHCSRNEVTEADVLQRAVG